MNSCYTTISLRSSFGLLCGLLIASAQAQQQPSIQETVTFFYYEDITAAAHFYEETLGFEKTMSEDWVKIYRISPSSSVGLVQEQHGFHNAADDKPVMLSIVTDDVNSWFTLLADSDVRVLKPLPKQIVEVDSSSPPIRGFVVEDPGGYTIEFFSWLND